MLTIGSLGKKTGTKVQTIRYYEQIGLMPEPGRTEGGQRRYGDAEVDRLSLTTFSPWLCLVPGFCLISTPWWLRCARNPLLSNHPKLSHWG